MEKYWSQYYERLVTANDAYVTNELAKLEKDTLPILEALFDGSAKNRWGHPYRNIGALGSAYVTVKLLGVKAKPLEKYLRDGVDNNYQYAIEALLYIGSLEDQTAIALSKALVREPFNGAELPLIKYNKHNQVEVLNIIRSSKRAFEALEKSKQSYK